MAGPRKGTVRLRFWRSRCGKYSSRALLTDRLCKRTCCALASRQRPGTDNCGSGARAFSTLFKAPYCTVTTALRLTFPMLAVTVTAC